MSETLGCGHPDKNRACGDCLDEAEAEVAKLELQNRELLMALGRAHDPGRCPYNSYGKCWACVALKKYGDQMPDQHLAVCSVCKELIEDTFLSRAAAWCEKCDGYSHGNCRGAHNLTYCLKRNDPIIIDNRNPEGNGGLSRYPFGKRNHEHTWNEAGGVTFCGGCNAVKRNDLCRVGLPYGQSGVPDFCVLPRPCPIHEKDGEGCENCGRPDRACEEHGKPIGVSKASDPGFCGECLGVLPCQTHCAHDWSASAGQVCAKCGQFRVRR